jgi:hypothetical protein
MGGGNVRLFPIPLSAFPDLAWIWSGADSSSSCLVSPRLGINRLKRLRWLEPRTQRPPSPSGPRRLYVSFTLPSRRWPGFVREGVGPVHVDELSWPKAREANRLTCCWCRTSQSNQAAQTIQVRPNPCPTFLCLAFASRALIPHQLPMPSLFQCVTCKNTFQSTTKTPQLLEHAGQSYFLSTLTFAERLVS